MRIYRCVKAHGFSDCHYVVNKHSGGQTKKCLEFDEDYLWTTFTRLRWIQAQVGKV